MIKINRSYVIDAFKKYISSYDLSDPKINLKIDHTYHVADMCDTISSSLSFDENYRDIAWFIGMMHDIGRFEQLRRYNTFLDRISLNHAALSADILFNNKLICNFLNISEKKLDNLKNNISYDSKILNIIEKAVRFHNLKSLPNDMTDDELLFANILRDADKIDILRVCSITPHSEIYDIPEDAFRTASYTIEVYEDAINCRDVDRSNSKTGIDFITGHIAFIYGIVFTESFRQIVKQGYLAKLMDFKSINPDTIIKFENVCTIAKKYIFQKCGEQIK